jgi:hypothetical protein
LDDFPVSASIKVNDYVTIGNKIIAKEVSLKMSQEKITIALIGEDGARVAVKAMIADFVQEYDATQKREKTPVPAASTRHILQNFSFEGYQVDIVEVLLEDQHPLAIKIGGKGDRCQKIDLYESNTDLESENISNDKECVRLKTQENYQLIKDTLQEAIGVKKLLDTSQKAILEARKKTTSSQTATTTIEKKAIQQKTSNSPWYQKSKWALLGLVFSVMASMGLLTGLALTGFLLTPFIALPLVFLVSAILLTIKIGYDNRSSQSVVTTPDADHRPNARFDDIPTYNRSDAHQASKTVERTETWDTRFRQLLFRNTAGGSQYMCIGENWDEPLGPDKFFIPDTMLEKNKNGFLELSIQIRNSCNTLSIPICVENAPIIREMIVKNYSGEFLKDSKPTKFAKKVQNVLDSPLQNIPQNLLNPKYTKSLQKNDTEQVTESSKGLRQ